MIVFLKTIFKISLTIFCIFAGIRFNNGEIYHKIPIVNAPQQVIWLDSNTLAIVDDENILEFKINDKVLRNINTRLPNEFIGFDKENNLIICNFEHFLINSYDDFSTKFTFFDIDRNILNEWYFFETIRPIFLYDKTLIAVTALDFLEQHYYEIDISTGTKKEIDQPKRKYIELNNSFRKVFNSKWGNIYEDINGDLLYK